MPAVPRSPRTGLPLIPKGAGRRTCRCDDIAPALLRAGIAQFNDGAHWECHETLEGVWKKTYEGEKDLIQGIILVAAAFVHYQKNENEICLSILKRAMEKIGSSSGKYYKIDVDILRNKVSEIIHSGTIMTFRI